VSAQEARAKQTGTQEANRHDNRCNGAVIPSHANFMHFFFPEHARARTLTPFCVAWKRKSTRMKEPWNPQNSIVKIKSEAHPINTYD
jgi:hypothetical protein